MSFSKRPSCMLQVIFFFMMEACGDAVEFQEKNHKTAKYEQFNNDIVLQELVLT